MNYSFKSPRGVIWQKVDGDQAEGLLTSNLDLVPEDQRPTTSPTTTKGLKRLFCLQRNRWVSIYTKNILAVA